MTDIPNQPSVSGNHNEVSDGWSDSDSTSEGDPNPRKKLRIAKEDLAQDFNEYMSPQFQDQLNEFLIRRLNTELEMVDDSISAVSESGGAPPPATVATCVDNSEDSEDETAKLDDPESEEAMKQYFSVHRADGNDVLNEYFNYCTEKENNSAEHKSEILSKFLGFALKQADKEGVSWFTKLNDVNFGSEFLSILKDKFHASPLFVQQYAYIIHEFYATADTWCTHPELKNSSDLKRCIAFWGKQKEESKERRRVKELTDGMREKIRSICKLYLRDNAERESVKSCLKNISKFSNQKNLNLENHAEVRKDWIKFCRYQILYAVVENDCSPKVLTDYLRIKNFKHNNVKVSQTWRITVKHSLSKFSIQIDVLKYEDWATFLEVRKNISQNIEHFFVKPDGVQFKDSELLKDINIWMKTNRNRPQIQEWMKLSEKPDPIISIIEFRSVFRRLPS